MTNKKLTNAELAKLVEAQKETMSLIKIRISNLADQLFVIQEDMERFKIAVGRDIEHLNERTI